MKMTVRGRHSPSYFNTAFDSYDSYDVIIMSVIFEYT